MGSCNKMVTCSRTGDFYTMSDEVKQSVLSATPTPLDTELQRGLLDNRVFPRGSQANDGQSMLRAAPVLHSRMRRELLEDLYGVRAIAPGRRAELMCELAALPPAHAVDCLRDLPISTSSKLSIFRELELGSTEVEVGFLRDLRRIDHLRNANSELISTVSPARMLALANEVRLQQMRPGDRFDCVKNMPVSAETKLQLTTEMGLHSVLDVELLREETAPRAPKIPYFH